jgi:hypothetical protein
MTMKRFAVRTEQKVVFMFEVAQRRRVRSLLPCGHMRAK